MKTQEEKLQHVMEAAGECRHDIYFRMDETIGRCHNCSVIWPDTVNINTSTEDFIALFRLTEKLFGRDCRIEFSMHYGDVMAVQMCKENKVVGQGRAGSKGVAMLNALFIATGGKDE